jgi:hypothetical protein
MSSGLRISRFASITLTSLSMAVLNWWRGISCTLSLGVMGDGEPETVDLASLLIDGLQLLFI